MKERWKWGPAAVILVAVGFFLLTRPIEAFSGPEHIQISNLGLWIAYEGNCRHAFSPGPACNAAESLLACVEGNCETPGQHVDLGAFTRAGDFFTRIRFQVNREARTVVQFSKQGSPANPAPAADA